MISWFQHPGTHFAEEDGKVDPLTLFPVLENQTLKSASDLYLWWKTHNVYRACFGHCWHFLTFRRCCWSPASLFNFALSIAHWLHHGNLVTILIFHAFHFILVLGSFWQWIVRSLVSAFCWMTAVKCDRDHCPSVATSLNDFSLFPILKYITIIFYFPHFLSQEKIVSGHIQRAKSNFETWSLKDGRGCLHIQATLKLSRNLFLHALHLYICCRHHPYFNIQLWREGTRRTCIHVVGVPSFTSKFHIEM